MKKTRKRLTDWEIKEPPFIILNMDAQVYTGLIGGYPNFSDNLDDAKPLEGQAKFETLRRFTKMSLEQIFI
jgi:hypothetical protein